MNWPGNYKKTELVETAAMYALTDSIYAAHLDSDKKRWNGQKDLLDEALQREDGRILSLIKMNKPSFFLNENFCNVNKLNPFTASLISFYSAAYWFDRTRNAASVNEKLEALNMLSPRKEGVFSYKHCTDHSYMLFLGNVIKQEAEDAIQGSHHPKIRKLKNAHVAGFGTGGDGIHTINLTTLCMTLAAQVYKKDSPQGKLNFIKVSTKAVTGEIGGADVADLFLKKIRKPDNFEIVTLGELGFPYSPELVEARRRFAKQEGEYRIDPYKILYPPVNLTNGMFVTTGCHPELLEHVTMMAMNIVETDLNYGYRRIKEEKEQWSWPHQLLVASEHGNDEAMMGLNATSAFFTQKHHDEEKMPLLISDLGFKFSEKEVREANEFLKEQPTVQMQAKRMHQIMGVEKYDGKIPDAANFIVSMNTALCLPEVIAMLSVKGLRWDKVQELGREEAAKHLENYYPSLNLAMKEDVFMRSDPAIFEMNMKEYLHSKVVEIYQALEGWQHTKRKNPFLEHQKGIFY